VAEPAVAELVVVVEPVETTTIGLFPQQAYLNLLADASQLLHHICVKLSGAETM